MLPTIRYIKIDFVKKFLAVELEEERPPLWWPFAKSDRSVIGNRGLHVPRAGSARRQALWRAGTSSRQSGTPRNDPLFCNPWGTTERVLL